MAPVVSRTTTSSEVSENVLSGLTTTPVTVTVTPGP